MSRSRFRLSAFALATTVSLAPVLPVSLPGAHAAPARPNGASGPPMLGLPSLATAQEYVLAPSTRTVRPVRVRQASRINHDFVTAASRTSEVSAHDLRLGTSDVAEVGGYPVRRAGAGVAGGEFGYTLRVPRRQPVVLRVEEAGSDNARYEVLVNGVRVHIRELDLYAAQGRPIGLTHYDVAVPKRLVRSTRLRVIFRNTDDPGDGARIHAVGQRRTRRREARGRSPPAGVRRQRDRSEQGDAHRPHAAARQVLRPAVRDLRLRSRGRRHDQAARQPRVRTAAARPRVQRVPHVPYDGLRLQPGPVGHRDRDPLLPAGQRWSGHRPGDPRRLPLPHGVPRLAGPRRAVEPAAALHGGPGQPRPAEYAGAFLSSDQRLNKLWYSGAYTTQMATIGSDTGRPYPAGPGPVRNDQTVAAGTEFLSDGAKRDRYDWGGDNVVSNSVSYLTTGRTEPARNALDWFAAHPSPAGQVPGVYLPEPAGFTYNWGEYAAWWTQNYYTHFLYTGDQDYLEKWFPTLVDNIAWIESNVGDDGLWNVPAAAGATGATARQARRPTTTWSTSTH